MTTEQDYFEGRCAGITKTEEDAFLMSQKNSGSVSEKYVEKVLQANDVVYKKHCRIKTSTGKIVIPDFYLEHYGILLEVKSRGYNMTGTASEKMDHVPRKYSNTGMKVIVVFCAAENLYSRELIEQPTEYSRDFCQLAKKYGVEAWISVKNLIETLAPYKILDVRPFVKWAGGKKRLVKDILPEFPKEFNQYHEPFVGGGALFFNVGRGTRKCFISDTNESLIDCYKAIRDKPEELIAELMNDAVYANKKSVFLENRKAFNDEPAGTIKKCALFIYLNKCCFNGLYRVNSSGKFNVPFGDMKNPKVCDTELLRDISKFLQNTDIRHCAYSDAECINPEDLVYLDPPYHKTFSDYQKENFGEDEHIALKLYVDGLTARRVNVVLSNSDTPFVRELYKNYTIRELGIKYSVGGDRLVKNELLIKNF
jgi:DNA adenine methylase